MASHFSFNLNYMIIWAQIIVIHLVDFCFSYIMACEGIVINMMLTLWLSIVKTGKEEVWLLGSLYDLPMSESKKLPFESLLDDKYHLSSSFMVTADSLYVYPCTLTVYLNNPRGSLGHVWQKRHYYARCVTVNSTTNATAYFFYLKL